ncbi:hypothetical protein VFPPC_18169 [Pochonia chlamydosporia 170]|uniref:Uncharacterized protein n=1 Tax=Pochonia chlamydosporia 170 TaxID=1380566 RepID=A0A219AS83_METCM|nr:hypothetical protein VFPPC_18169 [Pochonia chlamydosporia 170]OWT43628.1 hypothetical protein VFPPC_18169 [Pochonia chlamydosporia 170]
MPYKDVNSHLPPEYKTSAEPPPPQLSPSPSPTSSSSSISTAVVATIVLSAVAGAVLISLAVVIITLKVRQKRNKPRPPSVTTTDHKPSSVNASSTILNSPGLSPFPHLTDMPYTPERDLRAPPRLGDRKFHQTTRSEGAIQMPKKTYTYTRRGKPSSLGNVPSAKDMALYTTDTQRILGATTPKYSIFPKAHKSAASTSTTSTLGPGSRSSPPATPVSIPDVVNGLVSPGPPPRRALPSPPLKYWQVNPLEGGVPLENVRPEEIGIAIGSPTVDVQEKRERWPRLDERDMERLGGTYSPFKR